MITVVNGYVCTSSCEATKARHGQDPHQKANEIADPARAKDKPFDPAVILEGALKNSAVSATSAAAANPPHRRVDIFA